MKVRAYINPFRSQRPQRGQILFRRTNGRTKELTGQGPSQMMMTGHNVVLRGLNKGGREGRLNKRGHDLVVQILSKSLGEWSLRQASTPSWFQPIIDSNRAGWSQ